VVAAVLAEVDVEMGFVVVVAVVAPEDVLAAPEVTLVALVA